MNKEDEVPEITDTKFRALKKIIEYYDIKNLDRSEYASISFLTQMLSNLSDCR